MWTVEFLKKYLQDCYHIHTHWRKQESGRMKTLKTSTLISFSLLLLLLLLLLQLFGWTILNYHYSNFWTYAYGSFIQFNLTNWSPLPMTFFTLLVSLHPFFPSLPIYLSLNPALPSHIGLLDNMNDSQWSFCNCPLIINYCWLCFCILWIRRPNSHKERME